MEETVTLDKMNMWWNLDVYRLSNHRNNLSVSPLNKTKNLTQTETKPQGFSSFLLLETGGTTTPFARTLESWHN
jgi:hypothetical protein